MNPVNLLRNILHYFNIENELEPDDVIHEEIVKGITFKGTNLWILFFAILVASVGLNMNSTAVIIGAMLISPLMGPINGMGYSIATYNFPLFRKSLRNYSFAVIVGLVASTAYFAISPISTAHSELLARTSPTIYDVLIALFGGLAGIVAISTRQKGNVIPGVAIATALMPPLCTAGYGLASAQFEFFFGAFYLFTINTVFIAISSVTVSQVLKFPIRTLVDEGQKKRVNRWIWGIITIVILPSIYFGYTLVQNEKFTDYAKRYISNVSSYEGNYLLTSQIDAPKKLITLTYAGTELTPEQKKAIKYRAKDFNLESVEVVIFQGLSIGGDDGLSPEELKQNEELANLRASYTKQKKYIDSLLYPELIGKEILNELHALYPSITSVSFAKSKEHTHGKETIPVGFLLIRHKNGGFSAETKEKHLKWAKNRLKTQKITILYEAEPEVIPEVVENP